MTVRQSYENAMSPADRRKIHEWASEHVSLPPVLTKSGKFDASGSRQFIEPFDSLRSDTVREVNILAPVRSGKTLIADISAPWAIANDNASILWVFQNDQLAKSHAELRAMPTLKSVPAIQAIMPADRHKDRGQEIVFSSGLPLIICGPALGNLQSRGFKWVICDEPWLYAPGIMGQAKARLGDFVRSANSKFLAISQGGVEDDDWDIQFKSGELNEWHVACASCGHVMRPMWRASRPDGSRWGIIYDSEKDERKQYNVRKAIESLRFECEKCGHVHLDTARTRSAWNLSGHFVTIGEPNDTRKSYHWNALIDYPWSELLQEWLNARRQAAFGNHEPTIQFAQKRLAEPKSERSVHEGTLNFSRVEITDAKWEEEVARFVTVDRQSEDTYWLTARSWAKGSRESRRLTFRKCYSEADIIAAVEEIKPTRLQVMIESRPVQILAVFIDSGYQPKGDHGVYAMCTRNGWAALKGDDTPFYWHIVKEEKIEKGQRLIVSNRVQRQHAPWKWGDPGEGTREQGRRHSPLLVFSSNAMQDRLQELIDAGVWSEPDGDSETDMGREYERQMSSEYRKKRVNKFTGREELVWVCPSGNNHARDCAKMQVVAATITGLL